MAKVFTFLLTVRRIPHIIDSNYESKGGFEGGMTNRKYAGLTHVSRATAQRELADLVAKGILQPNPGGGRSASYDLVWDKIQNA
jgi:Fic family protein